MLKTAGSVSGGNGTVTSVAFSGGTTGLSVTGSPITTSGTITLGGTLAVASGGTGAANVATARLNLSAAQSGTNTDITSIALTSGTITTSPTANTDIVNKLYADSIAEGINFHEACSWATTANLGTVTYNNGTSGVGATLTNAGTQAVLVIDGHTFDGDDVTNATRVLVKNQTSSAQNGVYTVTNQGSGSTNWVLTRATDFDTAGPGVDTIAPGDFFLVVFGTANANTAWVQQTPLPVTVGTTGITFIQFGAASGGVSSFSGGTTGLTPNTATSGAITVAGTLNIVNGGTGATSLANASITTYSGTETLTNKRINPRVIATANATTLTPDISAADQYNLTAQDKALTIAAPTGTPVDGNKLIIRVTGNTSSYSVTWNATYTNIGVTLPTTTVASKTIYVGSIYNAANTRWDVVAVTTQA
jgi:hypothetical protein